MVNQKKFKISKALCASALLASVGGLVPTIANGQNIPVPAQLNGVLVNGADYSDKFRIHPVMITLDESLKPGPKQECVVVGDSMLDENSNRVQVKVLKMTCLVPDEGSVIEWETAGYVVAADGISGVAGELIDPGFVRSQGNQPLKVILLKMKPASE